MAVDMFLKLDGIKGESQDHKHKDEIQIESFSWGASQTSVAGKAGGAGGGAGKATFQDISITKFTDKSSPLLLQNLAAGKHIKDGMLVVRKAGDKPLEYLKIKLTDILVSGYQTSGHGSDLLTENVTLSFATFKLEYSAQKNDGSGESPQVAGWDLKANKAV